MPLSRLLPFINAIWRVPVILLMTAALSTLSVIFSIFDDTGRLQHSCSRLWSRFIFWVSRVELDIEGVEKLDPGRGYVFVANHLSMFDHWAFLAYFPSQVRFAAKASLFHIPFLGWHLRRSANIPVYRTKPRLTLRAFQGVAKRIQQGISYVIYPEGMRTWDGKMVTFKKGAFLLARYAEAPLVPVTIIGAHRRLPRGSVVIRPGRFRMVIHSPLEFEDYSEAHLQVLADRVRDIIMKDYPVTR